MSRSIQRASCWSLPLCSICRIRSISAPRHLQFTDQSGASTDRSFSVHLHTIIFHPIIIHNLHTSPLSLLRSQHAWKLPTSPPSRDILQLPLPPAILSSSDPHLGAIVQYALRPLPPPSNRPSSTIPPSQNPLFSALLPQLATMPSRPLSPTASFSSFLLFTSFLILSLLTTSATAQFNIFEQMFGGGGGQAHFHHNHQQSQQRQNVGSDASWWRGNWDNGAF